MSTCFKTNVYLVIWRTTLHKNVFCRQFGNLQSGNQCGKQSVLSQEAMIFCEIFLSLFIVFVSQFFFSNQYLFQRFYQSVWSEIPLLISKCHFLFSWCCNVFMIVVFISTMESQGFQTNMAIFLNSVALCLILSHSRIFCLWMWFVLFCAL